MYRRWIPFSRALEEYGLSGDQLEAALRFGLVEYKSLGGHGRLVKRADLEARLEEIRRFPERCWVFKSEAARKYGLTMRQLERAMAEGLVRFYEVENPYYRRVAAYKLFEPDIVANLERIRSFPRYTEEDIRAKKAYRIKSRLRGKLGFYCPRCGEFIRVRRDSALFEDMWPSLARGEGVDEFRRAVIIAHYRHTHTDYDVARADVERWLDGKELERWLDIVGHYEERKYEMDRDEREMYIEEIRLLRAIASERAKKYYSKLAAELAAADGLIPRPASPSGGP